MTEKEETRVVRGRIRVVNVCPNGEGPHLVQPVNGKWECLECEVTND